MSRFTEPPTLDRLVAEFPAPYAIDPQQIADRAAGGPVTAILDDDPTGTQTVSGVPVLTRWQRDDLQWALSQPGSAFFVLTNSRSLSPDEAAARTKQVVATLAEVAAELGIEYAVASRSDSTLRGHFPLETDVIAAEIEARSGPVDAVLVVPAFPDAGRVTVDSVHWVRGDSGMVPAGQTEFARDATFGYASSDLREWVAEKTGGAVATSDVIALTLRELRAGPDRVAELLAGLSGGRVVVVDAVTDDDLRVLAMGLQIATEGGRRYLTRIGPGFVRAVTGQPTHPPLDPEQLRHLGTDRGHGLVAVGSHVALTTAQLAALRGIGGLREFELDVRRLLDPEQREAHIAQTAAQAADALQESDVVIGTSRELVTGADPDDSLAIARSVSAALAQTVGEVVAQRRPAFVVAKGGITSNDVATAGLGINRAVVRGTMLPGLVSLWQPVDGPYAGAAYVVFPGNVGDAQSLADVVRALRGDHVNGSAP